MCVYIYVYIYIYMPMYMYTYIRMTHIELVWKDLGI